MFDHLDALEEDWPVVFFLGFACCLPVTRRGCVSSTESCGSDAVSSRGVGGQVKGCMMLKMYIPKMWE